MTQIHVTTTYTVIDCCNCGALFAVPDQVNEELVRTGRRFYCPNGHSQSYTESTKAQLRKAKDALAREQARNDQLRAERDASDRRASAAKGQVTKIRNRVARGVCPCCNRTFADLAAHMATKHPDYAPKVSERDGTIADVTTDDVQEVEGEE
jgi:hypothetical protein